LIRCFKRYNPSSKIPTPGTNHRHRGWIAKIPKGSASDREYRERAHRWRPTPDGLNHPPWYDYPEVAIQDSPFQGQAWELPVPPLSQRYRKIFHEEGCSCPSDSVLAVPGLSDFQAVPEDKKLCPDSRLHPIRIQECVDLEFNLLFAFAQGVGDNCKLSQELLRVHHYCNLPCNAERTRQGKSVGRLLYPVVYDVLKLDCLRWLQPGHVDRHCKAALRIVPVIIEQCIYKTKQYGPRGIAPPVPATWGFSLPTTETVIKYAYLRENSPPFEYPLQGEAAPLVDLPVLCSLPTFESKDYYVVD
jgi:hypothetical protein